MGHISRRLQYQLSNRRLALPGTFLQAARLEPGATVVALKLAFDKILVLSSDDHQTLATFGKMSPAAPSNMVALETAELTVGSGGRLVLPRQVSFAGRSEKLELSWTLTHRQLLLEVTDPSLLTDAPATQSSVAPGANALEVSPESSPVSASASAAASASAPTPLPSSARETGGFRFAALPEGLVLPGPVVQVGLFDIHGFDPDLPPENIDADLEEDIALQGMLRPVVLSGPAPHRVVDGRKRLQVAWHLKLEQVPAILMGALSREDLARLRYLLETTSDRWNTARQLRALSRLYLNGATLDQLSHLLRRNRRTIQRYLRIANQESLIRAIELGKMSLLEAEKVAGNKGKSDGECQD